MRPFTVRLLAAAAVAAVLGALIASAYSARSANAERSAALQRQSQVRDHGVLLRLAPRSATTWWAIVASNLHPKTFVVRTTDSGRHWKAVTPPVKLVASSSFLGTKTAWVEADALHAGAPGAPKTEPVYRTLNGGRSWQGLARVVTDCQLDFVDLRHGWCISIGAAMGSSTVHVYRTSDGGSTWKLVSRTGLDDHGSTPGALPYGCDKTMTFTSRLVGWAAEYCNAGRARLYTSRDGGARWQQVALPRLPKGAPSANAGGGISLPAVHGSSLTVSIQLDGTSHLALVIATRANGGRNWRSRLTPGDPRYGTIDLVDTRHFVLSNGTTLLATKDAGRHWHGLQATRRFVKSLGTPLTPDFLSPRLGFAVPTADDGPMWWTADGGTSWKRITITAGPFTLR